MLRPMMPRPMKPTAGSLVVTQFVVSCWGSAAQQVAQVHRGQRLAIGHHAEGRQRIVDGVA